MTKHTNLSRSSSIQYRSSNRDDDDDDVRKDIERPQVCRESTSLTTLRQLRKVHEQHHQQHGRYHHGRDITHGTADQKDRDPIVGARDAREHRGREACDETRHGSERRDLCLGAIDRVRHAEIHQRHAESLLLCRIGHLTIQGLEYFRWGLAHGGTRRGCCHLDIGLERARARYQRGSGSSRERAQATEVSCNTLIHSTHKHPSKHTSKRAYEQAGTERLRSEMRCLGEN